MFNVRQWIEAYNKTKLLKLSDIKGHALDICYHKDGAHIMEDELVEGKTELLHAVIAEIEPHICELSNDINGN